MRAVFFVRPVRSLARAIFSSSRLSVVRICTNCTSPYRCLGAVTKATFAVLVKNGRPARFSATRGCILRVSQGGVMAFCPICARNHDPDIGCLDATGQAIRDMGLPRASDRGQHFAERGAPLQTGRALDPGYRWSLPVDHMATPRRLVKSRVGDNGGTIRLLRKTLGGLIRGRRQHQSPQRTPLDSLRW